MRRILVMSFVMLAAGCATTTRPVVESPVPQLPPHDAKDGGARATSGAVAETERGTEPLSPASPVASKPLEPVDPPAVTRKWLGLEDFAEANDEKLLNVYVGMSRLAVERLMDGYQSGKWTNPYKHQAVVGADGKTHEVLFYLTRAPRQGQRVTESFLTPVIFQHDRVTAIGRYPLKKLRRAACQSRAKGVCP